MWLAGWLVYSERHTLVSTEFGLMIVISFCRHVWRGRKKGSDQVFGILLLCMNIDIYLSRHLVIMNPSPTHSV